MELSPLPVTLLSDGEYLFYTAENYGKNGFETYKIQKNSGEFEKSFESYDEAYGDSSESGSIFRTEYRQDKKSAIKRIDDGDIAWEISPGHRLYSIISSSKSKVSDNKKYWHRAYWYDEGAPTPDPECRYPLDYDERVYYYYTDLIGQEEEPPMEGIGCIDSQTGDILWETGVIQSLREHDDTEEMGLYFFEDYLRINGERYSLIDGKKIENGKYSEPPNLTDNWSGLSKSRITRKEENIYFKNELVYLEFAKPGDGPFLGLIESSRERRILEVSEKNMFIVFLEDKTLFAELPK